MYCDHGVYSKDISSSSSCHLLITKTVRGLLSDSSCPVQFMLRAIERGLDPLTTESSLACCSWDMSAGDSPPASESSSACCSLDMSAGDSPLANESSSACCSWDMSAEYSKEIRHSNVRK